MHRHTRILATIISIVTVLTLAAPSGTSMAYAAGQQSRVPPGQEKERLEAQRQYQLEHSDKSGKVRPDLWLKGMQQAKRMKIAAGIAVGAQMNAPTASSPGAGGVVGVQWTQIGPAPLRIDQEQIYQGTGPDSGEVVDVAIDPRNTTDQTIYIATNDGGVWKSTNGGTSWSPKTDFMPSQSMGALALDPGNPSVVYAGTGNPFDGGVLFSKGVGIYKSIDGGDTWSIIGAGPFTGKTITRMVMPTSNVLIVATSSGIYKSVDGGLNFGANAPNFNDGVNVLGGSATDLALDTSSPSTTVYAAMSGSGLFESTDAGSTFSTNLFSNPGAPTSFTFLSFSQSFPPNNGVIYSSVATGSGPKLFRSTDGGLHWTQQTGNNLPTACGGTGGAQCGYDQTVGVDPQDPNRVYVGFQELSLSTDGGANFGGTPVTRNQVHWDHHALRFSPQAHWGGGAPTRFYVGTDGGIAVTANGGTNWTNINEGIATNLFKGIDIGRGTAANNAYTYGGAQDTGTSEHQPGFTGADWHLGIDGDGNRIAVDPVTPTRAYTADDGGLKLTTDGGATWSSTGGLPTGAFLLAVDPINNKIVYASEGDNVGFTPGPQLFQSTDTGGSFTSIHTFSSGATAIATTPLDENVLWVGLSSGQVWKTTNALAGASSTWTQVTTGGSGGVGGIAIDPSNDASLVVVYNSFTGRNSPSAHVFKTTDAGATWSDISGSNADTTQNLPDLPLHSVVIDPGTTPHAFIVASDAGVMRSADSGVTWQVLGVGLPTVDSTSLALDSSVTPSLLRIGTYGRSVFQLTFATGPLIAVNADLAFGVVALGSTATRIMQVFNVGSTDLHISSITHNGSNDFSITSGPPTPVTVIPGGEIDYTVTFTPTASGNETAGFAINSDDPIHPVYQVPASGAGGAPNIVVSGDLAFGTVARGTTATRDVTVYNTGTSPLHVASVALSPTSDTAFSVLRPATPQTIAPGSHLAWTIQFAPLATSDATPRTGTLLIQSDDPNTPTVQLNASGAPGVPVVAVGASSIGFGNIAVDDRTVPFSSDQTLVITNQASCALCDLSLTGLSIAGPGASDYSLVAPPVLPTTIGAGNTLTLTIRFNPVAGGSRAATLTVASSDPATPNIAVGLNGVGLLPAITSAPGMPNGLIFGPTVYDPVCGSTCGQTQNETFTDNGTAELIFDKVLVNWTGAGSSPFSVPGITSPLTRVAPGHNWVEGVTFHPTGGPSRALRAVLHVEDDVNGETAPITADVPLCGESTGRGIRVLVYDTSGHLVSSVSMLQLQSHGLTNPLNITMKNLTLTTINPPTSCQTIQFFYENQHLQATDNTVQKGSYYALTVNVGSKHAVVSFTLGVSEFKTIAVTVQ